MGYEVDFLPVKSGGAAISVRWGTPGHYKVLVYDGGTAVTGEYLVAHIEKLYMTSHVDYVVSSHPAMDHLTGLSVVLRNLTVGELWMHRPWACAERMATDTGPAQELERLAKHRRIPVREPFAGAQIGPFTVLSPRRDWYLDALLPSFGKPLPSAMATSRATRLMRFIRALDPWMHRPTCERLWPRPAIAAENESSAVLYGEFDGRGVLLTGRAGVQALEAAASHAEGAGIDLRSRLRLIQAPDAGNLGHLSAEVLDRIVGPSMPHSRACTKSAFISVSLEARQHLSRILTEALKRRGTASFATLGMSLHHWYQMPDRGWYRARPAFRPR